MVSLTAFSSLARIVWICIVASNLCEAGLRDVVAISPACCRRKQHIAFALAASSSASQEPLGGTSCLRHHQVNGIDCVEVAISSIPQIGSVVVLEATASAQDILVNLALGEPMAELSVALPTGDPYGAVLWPAASVVAHALVAALILANATTVATVVELGTGTGLVSLAARKAGAKRVIATDYEQLPLDLLRYAATKLPANQPPNTDNGSLELRLFDMCDMEQVLPGGDYVVAADVMYEPRTGRAVAHRVVQALHQNSIVIVGDSPGRAGRPAFLQELRELLKAPSLDFQNVSGWTIQGPRNDLICGPESKTVTSIPQELTVALLTLYPGDYPVLLDKVVR